MPRNDIAATPALRLLDLAYESLLRGDFSALPELTRQLEHQVHQGAGPLDAEALQLIRQKADRNAVVLLAAQRGIRSARRRVAEIRAAASGLVTYDRSGKRAETAEAGSLAQRL